MKRFEIEEALERITALGPIEEVEEIDIKDGLGRVIAEDIYSPIDLPLFDKSPLDGFCFDGEGSEGGQRLKVVDEIMAGSVANKSLEPGQATRIMTGAKFPKGANTVARLESVIEEDGYIILDQAYKPYTNFVKKGEEWKKGDLVLKYGQALGAVDLGTLANLGIGQIKTYRMPRIGVLSTGSELVGYHEEISEGKIYNSNSITLSSRLRELGFDVDYIDQADDDPEILFDTLAKLEKDLDLIISTGGVSVGDADYMDRVLNRLGAQDIFSKAAMKPGGHILVRKTERAVYLALSGNPFAALATFEIFGRAVLTRLTAKDLMPRKVPATMTNSFPKASKGRRLIRAFYQDGKVEVPLSHESGQIGSASSCNSLIDIKAGSPPLKPGDEVEVFIL